ncbi:MAG: J domain-containing protein [Bacilli bacterium]|nr:J domain-containing protein [Bacilli bacterium]
MRNPYEVLGLSIGTSVEECKKAYRKLCRENHPDNGGDSHRFDEINKAWSMIQSGESQLYVEMQRPKTKLTHVSLFNFTVN